MPMGRSGRFVAARRVAAAAYVAVLLGVMTLPAHGGDAEGTRQADGEGLVKDLTKQLAAAPQDASLWHKRAKARLAFEDPVGAAVDASEAIRLAPFVADYRVTRAQLLAVAGRWAEVVADATDGLASGDPRADLFVL